MSPRDPGARLVDVVTACDVIADCLAEGMAESPADPLGGSRRFDAVRMRLIEIGEAIIALQREQPALLATEPNIPWREIGDMKNFLTHQYFDTTHTIVTSTARRDVPSLRDAAQRLIESLP